MILLKNVNDLFGVEIDDFSMFYKDRVAEARAVLVRLRKEEEAEKELSTIVETKIKAGPTAGGSILIKVWLGSFVLTGSRYCSSLD